MKRAIVILLFIIIQASVYSQYRQNLRGTIRDKTTEMVLPGANIALMRGEQIQGTTSNSAGSFVFENMPIGRYNIEVRYLGYEPFVMRNVELVSGKERVLDIALEEQAIVFDEIEVKAHAKGETINKMVSVSARSFSVRETERYAGALGDPSRMASNFAGVITANDSRNDIIIRGNSPQGLLWRLEGVNIPNPNHFGALGSTGGPVSMLNNNLLTNSDFFTGAFPAEYGNALSGVFDLHMRNGNTSQHEFVAQAGFNGIEAGAEGPLSSKNNASYIANYRYSVPAFMDKLEGGKGNAVPAYQDLTFKIDVPRTKAGKFSLFCIAGDSHIEIDDRNGNGTSYDTPANTVTINKSRMGVIALTHRFFPDSVSNFYTTVSASYQGVQTSVDSLTQSRGMMAYFGEKNSDISFEASTKYTRRISSRNTFIAGGRFERRSIHYTDSVTGEVMDPPIFDYYIKSLQIDQNNLNHVSAYAQWQHKLNNHLTLYGGLYSRYFVFNNSWSVDPRASISYRFNNSSNISLAYGNHSQMQPMYVYFTEDYDRKTNTYKQTNTKLDFSKAHHIVAGYNTMLTKNLRFKTEVYYQHLYKIPVEDTSSYFSMINSGASFNQSRIESLVNEGLGRNYGTEISLEKYLDNHYYYMINVSLFDSKYLAGDGLWRNTEFNTNYVLNALGGYEIKINERAAIDINMRVTWSGGKRDLYIDLDKSVETGQAVYDQSKAYSQRGKEYFRLDARVSFKLNGKHITQEWALDVTNITDYKNLYSSTYDTQSQSIKNIYQQSRYPMFLYRINF